MQTPENAHLALTRATPFSFGWNGIAVDAKDCFTAFARFGMGFCPELIAPHDGSYNDDPVAPGRASTSCATARSIQTGVPADAALRAPLVTSDSSRTPEGTS